MSEYDVETLARIVGCEGGTPWEQLPELAQHIARKCAGLAVDAGWTPPGAARAGDELTEAERADLFDALDDAVPIGVAVLAGPIYDAAERILAARAAGEAGGDLARLRVMRDGLALERETRPKSLQTMEWADVMIGRVLAGLDALLDPAPRSDSRSRESEGHKLLPAEELAADGSES